jgi:hypothetical protein
MSVLGSVGQAANVRLNGKQGPGDCSEFSVPDRGSCCRPPQIMVIAWRGHWMYAATQGQDLPIVDEQKYTDAYR